MERTSRNFCVDKGNVINIYPHLRVHNFVLFSFFREQEKNKIGSSDEGSDTTNRKFGTGNDGAGEGICEKAEDGTKAEGEEEYGAVVIPIDESYNMRYDKSYKSYDTAAGYRGGNQYGRNDEHA